VRADVNKLFKVSLTPVVGTVTSYFLPVVSKGIVAQYT
jgi:hypothetical protein